MNLRLNNVPIRFWLFLLDLYFLEMDCLADILFLSKSPIRSNVTIIEDPAIGLSSRAIEKKYLERRTLHVSWSEKEAKLSYTIYSNDPRERGEWIQSSPDESEQIKNFWQNLNDILDDAIPIGSPSDEIWECICIKLQGIGKSLFNSLIPSPVQKCIQRWESGFSVRISSNENWIPWELMHDGQNFLGDKFIFTRYPRSNGGEACPDEDRQQYQRSKQIQKIVNVVGGNIGEQSAHKASKLFVDISEAISIKLLREESISKLTRTLEQADILHFTCHGHSEPKNLLQIASDKSSIKNLCLDTVKQLPLKPGSFIFANACSSTIPVKAFNEFSSFGWEFYQKGADVFIGTLGIVPTKYAIDFAENVYRELLCEDTQITVGEAIASAKKTAAEQHNFFWLLYCIYGNPDVYFESIE